MTLITLITTAPAAIAHSFSGAVRNEVPVNPDSDEATQWLINELSKAPYQAAKPTFFDRAAKAFGDWLGSLFTEGDGGFPALALVVIVGLIAVAIIAGILIYGMPRLNRKSRHQSLIFGEEDYRTAAQLREAAEQAAAREDFTEAISDMFRSIARGLSERTLVTMTPGTTGHGFASRAARIFPELAGEFAASADIFDLVRYMRKPATRYQYDQLRTLEARVRASQPNLAEATL